MLQRLSKLSGTLKYVVRRHRPKNMICLSGAGSSEFQTKRTNVDDIDGLFLATFPMGQDRASWLYVNGSFRVSCGRKYTFSRSWCLAGSGETKICDSSTKEMLHREIVYTMVNYISILSHTLCVQRVWDFGYSSFIGWTRQQVPENIMTGWGSTWICECSHRQKLADAFFLLRGGITREFTERLSVSGPLPGKKVLWNHFAQYRKRNIISLEFVATQWGRHSGGQFGGLSQEEINGAAIWKLVLILLSWLMCSDTLFVFVLFYAQHGMPHEHIDRTLYSVPTECLISCQGKSAGNPDLWKFKMCRSCWNLSDRFPRDVIWQKRASGLYFAVPFQFLYGIVQLLVASLIPLTPRKNVGKVQMAGGEMK